MMIQSVINALRCANSDKECKGSDCQYRKITDNYWGICDYERIGLDAADLLERLTEDDLK